MWATDQLLDDDGTTFRDWPDYEGQGAVLRGPDFLHFQAAMEPFDVAVAHDLIERTFPILERRDFNSGWGHDETTGVGRTCNISCLQGTCFDQHCRGLLWVYTPAVNLGCIVLLGGYWLMVCFDAGQPKQKRQTQGDGEKKIALSRATMRTLSLVSRYRFLLKGLILLIILNS